MCNTKTTPSDPSETKQQDDKQQETKQTGWQHSSFDDKESTTEFADAVESSIGWSWT